MDGEGDVHAVGWLVEVVEGLDYLFGDGGGGCEENECFEDGHGREF